ncbi:hypothetical protein GJV85_04340 [Sulfurimonas aquatica]|uniref:Uncharacterized protein n=1 Tax=Sulfurimonas aquatica TaxID=2672570 RepID=A0A975AZH9_9BACT|nr:hypothetical protein [Sulfurimonas aquatica]QSZ41365.1 hypothetical protein GJV85_04340 [Sulfurimonas aquatica]
MILDGLYLYRYANSDRIELNGIHSKESIIELMVDEWIYYMECHKCGKSDYCKYTEPHNVNPDKKAEIKCGVAKDFITNYINNTFDSIEDLEIEQKQAYLDTAYYLSQYVQSAEIGIGTLINEDYLSVWGEFAPALYGFTKEPLDYLNKAHKEMKHVGMFRSKKSLILVEGYSENIFVDNFSDIKVVNYEGEGRIRYDKIEFLVQEYQEDGYEVYLQSDMDGKPHNDKVNKIINGGLIKEENIFQFKHDFESSIPAKLFYTILIDNELISDTFENFEEGIDLQRGIVHYVETKYDISINKRMIATEVSLAIHKYSRRRNLYQDERFLDTEIGKFWNFIRKVN